MVPGSRLVVDIGGQDSKVIALDGRGNVTDFLMNDKCAAGTGRFLQVMAGVLDLTLDELGELALISKPAVISSMFTGGLAGNSAICQRIEHSLGRQLQVPKLPQMAGAIGAALIGSDL